MWKVHEIGTWSCRSSEKCSERVCRGVSNTTVDLQTENQALSEVIFSVKTEKNAFHSRISFTYRGFVLLICGFLL